MLTPVEMQGRALKGGFGYKKKEVDDFLEEIFEGYEQLYKENAELKDKLAVLNEGLQYYKDLEGTLQKTLLVAEKTAESTKNASLKKAAAIEKSATIKAQMTISEAKKTMDKIQNQTVILMQQFENYRQQYKQILNAQMELLDSKAYSLPAFEPISMEVPSFEDTATTEDLAAVAQQISDAETAMEAAAAQKSVSKIMEDSNKESASQKPSAEAIQEEIEEELNTAFVAATEELLDLPEETVLPEKDSFTEEPPFTAEPTFDEIPLEKITLELPGMEEKETETDTDTDTEDSFEFLDI